MLAVEVKNLRKKYGDIVAVEDFSFTVEKGKIATLVGPDGAGKTTIFRCLCNLIEFEVGQIRIGEHDLAGNFEKIKPLLGYMPQNFSLYPDLSVEENLSFYAGLFGLKKDIFNKRKSELYRFSGLGPFAGRRAAALSGGMKQKLALSCNLIHDPAILFLDEPTTGVDPLSRRQFWEILKSLQKAGSSIIVSTPYMDEVAISDYAIFIHKGRKLAEGTPQQLSGYFSGSVYLANIFPSPEIMDRLNQIEGLICRRFGSSIHLYVDSSSMMDKFHDELEAIGITTDKISLIEPDLEDTFIQLMEQK